MRPDGGEMGGVPFGRSFLPGPAEVHPEVSRAMLRPLFGHRSPAFRKLMARLQEGLRRVFLTRRTVILLPSSATGLMEAALRNAAPRRLLCLVNGGFSERFVRIGRACGVEVERLEVPWGAVHDPDTLRRRLARGGIDAVALVHSETSTGALNPLRELGEVVREHSDALLLVDSVSGIGGVEVRTDDWGLDFVLTGSQKALALPPGLALGVASERLVERSREAEGKGLYFDVVEHLRHLDAREAPTTPALPLLFALERQLERIGEEGLEERWARHHALGGRCRAWVAETRGERGWEVGVLAPEPFASPTVTCMTLPRGVASSRLVEAVADRGYAVGPGYGPLAGTTIRIGHMGEHTEEELEGLLGALEEALGELLRGR